MSPDEQPPKQPKRPTRWETFTGWHREPATWREMYIRTASALAAALVVYLVAALSGSVTRRPLPVLSIAVAVAAIATAIHPFREWRRSGESQALAAGVMFVLLALVLVFLTVAYYARTWPLAPDARRPR